MRKSERTTLEQPCRLWKHFGVAACLLLAGWPGVGLAASFTATLDREAVMVGESATFTLAFDGEPKALPPLPSIPNLQFEGPSTGQSVTIVNNRVSASYTYSFSVTPTQPGEYTIPALQAEVGGQVLSSQPLKLVAQPGERLAFFKLALPRKEVFVGEVFPVELQMFVRQGMLNTDDILRSFDEFAGSGLKAEGFSVLRTAHARRRQMQVENNTYQVATLVSALSALKTGPLSISSMDAKFVVRIPVNSGRRSFFPAYREVQVALGSETETLTVLNLPRENVPANFNGAVGNYTLSVTAGPTNVAAGSPITVRIRLQGKGALDALALPAQPGWEVFKPLSPTAKLELTDALGLEGAKTFEQVAFPQSAEVKSLPPVSFSFFDPDQKKYQVITEPGLPLTVMPTAAAPTPTIAAGGRNDREAAPSQDIVPIKQRLGTLALVGVPLVQRPWFLALQSVPVLFWVGVLAWRKRVEQLAANPRLRRRRWVADLVRDGLATLRRQAAAQDPEAFFATLFRLLQEQLGERLDLPASSITEAIIEERLRPRGIPDSTLTRLHELFQACNLARYAPVKSSQELQSLIPEAEALMAEMKHLEP